MSFNHVRCFQRGILLTPFLAVLLLTSCNWEKGLEESNRGQISFEIVNSQYESVVAREGKPYHPDTIQVYNVAWKPQPLLRRYINSPNGETWEFQLYYLEGKVPVETNFKKLDKLSMCTLASMISTQLESWAMPKVFL